MEYGARNKLEAVVTSVTSGDVMSLVKFDVEGPCSMASVLTTESVGALGLKEGDKVTLVVKAVNVLPVKE
jgi:molybdopterin-binding protein